MQAEQALAGRIRARYGLVFLAALLFYLFMSVTFFLGAGWDDLFLTLWQGENLAAGHGFVNYDFERVEISSSLLHTPIIALVSLAAPEHTFLWNKALGLDAGAVCLYVIYAFRDTILGGADYVRQFAVSSWLMSVCYLLVLLRGLWLGGELLRAGIRMR